jgi:methylmalonyl-CoA/ethylmalonyl-CoA epimerase
MSASGSGLSITRIGQIGITVHDLDRAVGFYRDVLKLTFLFRVPNLAFFDCGGVRLLLGAPERPELDHPASILYYLVDDIHASHAALRADGAALVDEPHLIAKMPDHDLWMFFVKDGEGNVLGVMAEVRNG